MSITGQARVAGVAGWPVSHSLSPLMMNSWIAAAGLDALYAPMAIPPGEAKTVFRALAKTSLSGLNVTLPHKEDALVTADDASEAARAIGAANLLTFADGEIRADNTDGIGFMAALEPARIDFAKTTALVLGAGGASRALVYALREAGIAHVRLTNRNRARAEGLAADLAPDAEIVDWDQRSSGLIGAGLVVNGTSLGLKGETELKLDWTGFAAGGVVFDSVYSPLHTRFMREGAAAGARTIDGLDMLIGQARPSFDAFYGQAPDADLPIRQTLLAALGQR